MSIDVYRQNIVCLLHGISQISIYKLGDVGISCYLIGSLSLANGQCPPPCEIVCRAAIFVQTVISMHKLIERRNEAANCERMPITVDTLGEIKRDPTENSCLLFLNVLCCHRVCIC